MEAPNSQERVKLINHFSQVLITYVQKSPLNARAEVSSKTRCQHSGSSLHLHPYFVYRGSKDFQIGNNVQLHRLI